MSKTSRPQGSRPRALAAAVLAASLATAGLATASTPALADTIGRVEAECGRIAGADRSSTSAAIARAYDGQSSVEWVIIASGRNFPDALAASGVSRDANAPIILVEPDSLPAAAKAGLEQLDPRGVIIVGGTTAVSTGVETTLRTMFGDDVYRAAGENRYETAQVIANWIQVGAGELDGLTTAIIATGTNYPDALAGGPVSYQGDGTAPFPILLVDGDQIPAATEAALGELDVEQVVILGGTAAVTPAAQAALEAQTGNPAIRLAGDSREATARRIAEFAIAEQGFAPDAVLLADARLRFPSPDALAGGPLGGLVEAPILLVNPGLPADTRSFIESNPSIAQVIALGGTAAVPNAVMAAGCTAAGLPVDIDGPRAHYAEFENSDGARTGTFGDAIGDTIYVGYDEIIDMVDGTETIGVDVNGDGVVDVTIDCARPAIECSRYDSGADEASAVPNTVGARVVETGTYAVVFDGVGDAVIRTTGITDRAGNLSGGYPIRIN